MRRVSLAGRLSFALASRLPLRRLPTHPARGFLSLSFDDIPRSAWTEGGKILARRGLRATYFLCGDLCGKVFEGREQYRRVDVAEIVAAGHEIGSHLFSHHSTLTLTPGQVREQIALNDAFFREVVGPHFLARNFAYPFGEASLGAKWLCSRRFNASRSVAPGLNRNGADRDYLRVLSIDNIAEGATDWNTSFSAVAREGGWAILNGHGVDDTGHPYSCSPSRFEATVEQAQMAGLEILPIAEVMDRLVVGPDLRPSPKRRFSVGISEAANM